MANIAYSQPTHPQFLVNHPPTMNSYGQVNQVLPPFYIPPTVQTKNYSNPQSTHATQIAFVPVLVDAHGRPVQSMQNLMSQSYFPTVGLNQAMQAPWLQPSSSPQGSFPQISFPMQMQDTAPARSPSATSSDSGSTAGSVSPELPPLTGRLPPGFTLDSKDDSWYKVNEGLMALAQSQEAPKSKKIIQAPVQMQHKKKKFGYRSKQNKIDTVYAELVRKYSSVGTLVSQEEVLRGPDVIRLHVKKYDALCSIESALLSVERFINIVGVSIPLSMKNTFQKKGFLVYIKLDSVEHVEQAQTILRTYPEFKKCGVANVAPAPSAV